MRNAAGRPRRDGNPFYDPFRKRYGITQHATPAEAVGLLVANLIPEVIELKKFRIDGNIPETYHFTPAFSW